MKVLTDKLNGIVAARRVYQTAWWHFALSMSLFPSASLCRIVCVAKDSETSDKDVRWQAFIAFSRLGVYIRLPGVDVDRFAESMQGGGLLSYIDALSGGSISRVGIFSLGELLQTSSYPLDFSAVCTSYSASKYGFKCTLNNIRIYYSK